MPIVAPSVFTWTAPEGVHIHIGVELPGPQRFAAGHVTSDSLRRGPVRAHRGARSQAVLRLWLFLVKNLLALLFVPLGSTHVVDTEQHAVVHDLQPHQELGTVVLPVDDHSVAEHVPHDDQVGLLAVHAHPVHPQELRQQGAAMTLHYVLQRGETTSSGFWQWDEMFLTD
ncbi:hypothetical protein EYF80_016501 [Liparis tanakae]|uniref:Uncharacterized protein n=1 Tax=Liparis tanakae TaxID=230148 RepID=A0A4Z2I5X8_9TELE|nr:hypothetical protein EYF80_016501 [Liparis tanakae]